MANIFERIGKGEFENELPYPLEETLKEDKQYQSLTRKVKELKSKINSLQEEQKKLREDMKIAWSNEEDRLRTVFRKALEKEFNTSNHPKKGKIWLKAWEDGHSSGYREIAVIYDELVDLIV